MKRLLAVCIFLYAVMGLAEEIDILQLEGRMETRLTQVLKTVDPLGQVVVKVNLKNQKTTLPGASVEAVDLYDAGKFKKIQIESVQEFQIIVLSSLGELPTWLKEQLQLTADFNGVKKIFTYKCNF